MPGSNARGFQNQPNQNAAFQNGEEEFGTMHKGCWYPPAAQEPMPYNSMPFMPNEGQAYLVPCPPPFGMPGFVPHGNQGGNPMPMQMIMMMNGLPHPMAPGPPGNLDLNMMNPGMPGILAKVQPGMPPMPLLDPGMTALPLPLPPNMGQQQPTNYVAGTFMEDQIPHKTEPAPAYWDGRPDQASQNAADMLPEVLRNLSISPSQSELSCDSTNAYQSESPISSDTDNRPNSAESKGLTGDNVNDASLCGEEGNDVLGMSSTQVFAAVPEGHERRLDVQREKGNRAFEKRKPYTGYMDDYADERRQGPGYVNRAGLRTGARRGAYVGGGRPAPRGRAGPGPFSNRSSRAPTTADGGEWQTVERSGPKHRGAVQPPSRFANR